MHTFLSYFLAVNLLLVVQVAYYRLFLARQRRFQWNRIYLLAGMAIALLLPLIHWDIVPASLPDPSFIRTLPVVVIRPTPPAEAPLPWTTLDWVMAIYAAGVAVAFATLIFRHAMVLRLVWKGDKTPLEDCTLVSTRNGIGPAAYFRYIFWNAEPSLDPQSTAVALAHERCHCRQWHSADLMAVELLKAFCWINPATYLLRQDLRRTHEYLADQAALKVAGMEGIKRLLLLRQLGSRHLSLANYFHSHSPLRMKMLTQDSTRKSTLQYLLTLPLAGLMAACTSLGHPIDALPASLVADSFVTTTPTSQTPASFFSIEDLFVEAQMSFYAANPKEEALVCLGVQPPTWNLDSIPSGTPSEEMPQVLNMERVVKQMGYPKEARDQKITGKVIVRVLVDETGRVARHEFLKEVHTLLRDAVDAHVNHLRFKPGTKEGKAVRCWVTIPFQFSLEGC